MDDCNKCDSPCGSNIDSLIEKFRLEITKKSEEDLVNIKKLTIKASNKSRESSLSNRDIDKKISDLECLILRLQEELDDLSTASKQANKCKQEDECEVDYCCPVVNECEDPVPCPEEPETCAQENSESENCYKEDTVSNKIDEKPEKENGSRSSNHRFPIVLRDVGNLQEDSNKDVDVLKETISIDKEKTAEDIDEKNNPNIRQTMFYDMKKVEKEDEIKKEKANEDTESITNIIAELRAEINEKIHTLNGDN